MAPEPDADFAKRLLVLAEVFGEPMSPIRLGGYWAALSDIDPEDLYRGMDEALRVCTFWPKPAELRKLAVAEASARHYEQRLRSLPPVEDDPPMLEPPLVVEPAEPEPTPEERAERAARIEALWQELFTTAKRVGAAKAMPESKPTATVAQIAAWRSEEAR